ncbi:hypothetical protein DIPPA_12531 [Diplonema papillatum]|nr:hypothetical protein DIPPA_12531 [Diplonema papillatum]
MDEIRELKTAAGGRIARKHVDEGLRLWRSILPKARVVYGPGSTEYASLCGEAGDVYFAEGRALDARKYYEESLAITEELVGSAKSRSISAVACHRMALGNAAWYHHRAGAASKSKIATRVQAYAFASLYYKRQVAWVLATSPGGEATTLLAEVLLHYGVVLAKRAVAGQNPGLRREADRVLTEALCCAGIRFGSKSCEFVATAAVRESRRRIASGFTAFHAAAVVAVRLARIRRNHGRARPRVQSVAAEVCRIAVQAALSLVVGTFTRVSSQWKPLRPTRVLSDGIDLDAAALNASQSAFVCCTQQTDNLLASNAQSSCLPKVRMQCVVSDSVSTLDELNKAMSVTFLEDTGGIAIEVPVPSGGDQRSSTFILEPPVGTFPDACIRPELSTATLHLGATRGHVLELVVPVTSRSFDNSGLAALNTESPEHPAMLSLRAAELFEDRERNAGYNAWKTVFSRTGQRVTMAPVGSYDWTCHELPEADRAFGADVPAAWEVEFFVPEVFEAYDALFVEVTTHTLWIHLLRPPETETARPVPSHALAVVVFPHPVDVRSFTSQYKPYSATIKIVVSVKLAADLVPSVVDEYPVVVPRAERAALSDLRCLNAFASLHPQVFGPINPPDSIVVEPVTTEPEDQARRALAEEAERLAAEYEAEHREIVRRKNDEVEKAKAHSRVPAVELTLVATDDDDRLKRVRMVKEQRRKSTRLMSLSPPRGPSEASASVASPPATGSPSALEGTDGAEEPFEADEATKTAAQELLQKCIAGYMSRANLRNEVARVANVKFLRAAAVAHASRNEEASLKQRMALMRTPMEEAEAKSREDWTNRLTTEAVQAEATVKRTATFRRRSAALAQTIVEEEMRREQSTRDLRRHRASLQLAAVAAGFRARRAVYGVVRAKLAVKQLAFWCAAGSVGVVAAARACYGFAALVDRVARGHAGRRAAALEAESKRRTARQKAEHRAAVSEQVRAMRARDAMYRSEATLRRGTAAEHAAARRIQAAARGRAARAAASRKRSARARLSARAVPIQAFARAKASAAAAARRAVDFARHAAPLQKCGRGLAGRRAAGTLLAHRRQDAAARAERERALKEERRDELLQASHVSSAATTIQAGERGRQARAKMRAHRESLAQERQYAAVAVQKVVRGRRGRRFVAGFRPIAADEKAQRRRVAGERSARCGEFDALLAEINRHARECAKARQALLHSSRVVADCVAEEEEAERAASVVPRWLAATFGHKRWLVAEAAARAAQETADEEEREHGGLLAWLAGAAAACAAADGMLPSPRGGRGRAAPSLPSALPHPPPSCGDDWFLRLCAGLQFEETRARGAAGAAEAAARLAAARRFRPLADAAAWFAAGTAAVQETERVTRRQIECDQRHTIEENTADFSACVAGLFESMRHVLLADEDFRRRASEGEEALVREGACAHEKASREKAWRRQTEELHCLLTNREAVTRLRVAAAEVGGRAALVSRRVAEGNGIAVRKFSIDSFHVKETRARVALSSEEATARSSLAASALAPDVPDVSGAVARLISFEAKHRLGISTEEQTEATALIQLIASHHIEAAAACTQRLAREHGRREEALLDQEFAGRLECACDQQKQALALLPAMQATFWRFLDGSQTRQWLEMLHLEATIRIRRLHLETHVRTLRLARRDAEAALFTTEAASFFWKAVAFIREHEALCRQRLDSEFRVCLRMNSADLPGRRVISDECSGALDALWVQYTASASSVFDTAIAFRIRNLTAAELPRRDTPLPDPSPPAPSAGGPHNSGWEEAGCERLLRPVAPSKVLLEVRVEEKYRRTLIIGSEKEGRRSAERTEMADAVRLNLPPATPVHMEKLRKGSTAHFAATAPELEAFEATARSDLETNLGYDGVFHMQHLVFAKNNDTVYRLFSEETRLRGVVAEAEGAQRAAVARDFDRGAKTIACEFERRADERTAAVHEEQRHRVVLEMECDDFGEALWMDVKKTMRRAAANQRRSADMDPEATLQKRRCARYREIISVSRDAQQARNLTDRHALTSPLPSILPPLTTCLLSLSGEAAGSSQAVELLPFSTQPPLTPPLCAPAHNRLRFDSITLCTTSNQSKTLATAASTVASVAGSVVFWWNRAVLSSFEAQRPSSLPATTLDERIDCVMREVVPLWKPGTSGQFMAAPELCQILSLYRETHNWLIARQTTRDTCELSWSGHADIPTPQVFACILIQLTQNMSNTSFSFFIPRLILVATAFQTMLWGTSPCMRSVWNFVATAQNGHGLVSLADLLAAGTRCVSAEEDASPDARIAGAASAASERLRMLRFMQWTALGPRTVAEETVGAGSFGPAKRENTLTFEFDPLGEKPRGSEEREGPGAVVKPGSAPLRKARRASIASHVRTRRNSLATPGHSGRRRGSSVCKVMLGSPLAPSRHDSFGTSLRQKPPATTPCEGDDASKHSGATSLPTTPSAPQLTEPAACHAPATSQLSPALPSSCPPVPSSPSLCFIGCAEFCTTLFLPFLPMDPSTASATFPVVGAADEDSGTAVALGLSQPEPFFGMFASFCAAFRDCQPVSSQQRRQPKAFHTTPSEHFRHALDSVSPADIDQLRSLPPVAGSPADAIATATCLLAGVSAPSGGDGDGAFHLRALQRRVNLKLLQSLRRLPASAVTRQQAFLAAGHLRQVLDLYALLPVSQLLVSLCEWCRGIVDAATSYNAWDKSLLKTVPPKRRVIFGR